MKGWICIITGALGGVVAAAFGEWGFLLTALCILMGVDYISGLVVAGVFHKSPKSKNGGLESLAGLKGLIRKIATLCIVMVAHLVDRMIGTEYIRDATTIAFSLNEIISILENAGLMGIKLPAVLVKALDVLRQKAGEEDSKDTSSASQSSAPSPQGEGMGGTSKAPSPTIEGEGMGGQAGLAPTGKDNKNEDDAGGASWDT